MTQHYDVAVIGGQSSGLIAAALLAKRGRRVILLDHGENTTYYRRKGLRLPLVPTLVPFFESSPAVEKVHDELGLGPDLRTTSQALDPLFQAIMPRHRIDVRADRYALLEELRKEFPAEVDAVAAFFEKLFALDEEISDFLAESPPLPPAGLREKLRTRSLLARAQHLDAPFESHDLLSGFPPDHPLRELLLGPLTFFGHLGTDEPSTFHAVRLIARYYRGVLGFADRLGGLQATLLKVAEQAGVDIHHGAVVQNVELSGRRLMRVFEAGAKNAVTADYFIANTLGPFQELLPPNKLQAKYALEQRSVRPSGSLLVLNLVVEQQVIPRGMGHALFLLNGRRNPRDEQTVDPPLFLRRYPARRGEPGPVQTAEAIDDEQYEVLSIACPVQTADVSRSPERLAALKQQMLERVGRLVPFLRSFVVDTSLTVDTSGWDIEGEDTVRRIDPWTLHPIYFPAERPLLGVASRTTRTVFKNMVHCGRDVIPGLGLEGEYLAGLAAADTLGAIAGRAWKA
jgi:phytoene dehydrogenase-like protein